MRSIHVFKTMEILSPLSPLFCPTLVHIDNYCVLDLIRVWKEEGRIQGDYPPYYVEGRYGDPSYYIKVDGVSVSNFRLHNGLELLLSNNPKAFNQLVTRQNTKQLAKIFLAVIKKAR